MSPSTRPSSTADTKMTPGRKTGTSKHAAAEAPLTYYEKEMVQNMMRNNQRLQSLGVTALASLVNSSYAKGRRRASDHSRMHESEHNKENEQGIADKVLGNEPDIELTRNTFTSTGSKRVMALDEQDPPARMTRQRTKEQRTTEEGLQGTTTNTQEDALIAADSPTELDDQIKICNEGQSNAMDNDGIGEEQWAKIWIG